MRILVAAMTVLALTACIPAEPSGNGTNHLCQNCGTPNRDDK